MSKSLYQYKFDAEKKQLVEQTLRNAIAEAKYRNKGGSVNVFTYGNGWLTGKRRIEYKIENGVLSICIWKVVAPILPMIEMGCCDANSAYGALLNEGMKNAIKNIANKINMVCPLEEVAICATVVDNFFTQTSKVEI